jgi:hypothetical protein
MIVPQHASADTIAWADPVSGVGSSTTVGIYNQSFDATPDGVSNPTSEWIKYYIPLGGPGSPYGNTSGTYGVTQVPGGTAGTFADYGNGNGSYLDMFLMFSPVSQPVTSARLEFEFSDLDLRYVNDPVGFFEYVRFYSFNDFTNSASQVPISPLMWTTGSSTTTGYIGSGSTQINWEISRTAGTAGASWPVYIDLWGPGLNALLDGPAFWAQLHFTVPKDDVLGTNTPEYLRASLTTGTQPVPEPGSLLLLGAGLFAIVTARTRSKR